MKRFLILVVLVVLLFSFSGCASAPETSPPEPGTAAPPEWVLNPPEGDDEYMYFTGSGSSKTGDMAEAEEIARGIILDEIMKYLGQRVTSETTAEVRASVDSFKTKMVQRIKSSSSGRIAGLETSGRWVDKKEQAITMYLLSRYNRVDLLKEKEELEKIFQEAIDAVAVPEREGKRLEAEGLQYQAAISFMEAASAAFKSEIENADIKFERNMNQAKNAIRQVALVKINDNLKVNLGEEFTEAFKLKVVNGATAEDPGVSGVAVKVVYKELKSSGKKVIRTCQVKTDEQGVALFKHPPMEFVGKEILAMELDMSEAIESFKNVPDKFYDQIDGLEQLIRNKKVTFNFESISLAAKIATGIAVFNLDASGNPLSTTETCAGLLEELNQAGFVINNLPVDVSGIAGRQDAQIISFLKKNFSEQVKRVIYGTASISNHEQDGKFVIIQVTGSIKVAELETNKILLTINKSKRAQGTNASAALSAAFKKLGEDIGMAIINQLR